MNVDGVYTTNKLDVAQVKAANPVAEVIGRYATGETHIGGRPWWKCPFHANGDEKTPSLTVVGDTGFRCFACDAKGDVITFVMKVENTDFKTALEKLASGSFTPGAYKPDPEAEARRREKESRDRTRRIESAKRIWDEACPTPGTLVETYLISRSITLLPDCIRFHPQLKHADTGLPFPAMVCRVDGPNGEFVGIHRTYLTHDGRAKANVTRPKMALGPIGGGAVRLAPAGEALALAEGVETGLSVQQASQIPTWASLGTNFKSVVLPRDVKTIIIAADGDDVSEKAANKAAQYFIGAYGCAARIARAPKGFDFNDVLQWPEGKVVPFRHQEISHDRA